MSESVLTLGDTEFLISNDQIVLDHNKIGEFMQTGRTYDCYGIKRYKPETALRRHMNWIQFHHSDVTVVLTENGSCVKAG